MKIFFSQPRGFASNLPIFLQRVAKLYRAGVVDSSSTLWVNANATAPVFWVLTDRSSCFYWYDAPTSGTVRITKDRIRWGPSYETVTKDPVLNLAPASLSVLDEESHLTLIVDHNFTSEDSDGVGVVDNGKSQDALGLSGGYYAGSGLAVIDLPHFDRGMLQPLNSTYAAPLAYHAGVRLLTKGMARATKDAFIANIDDHSFSLEGPQLANLVEALDVFDLTAGWAVRTVHGNEAPAPGPSITV